VTHRGAGGRQGGSWRHRVSDRRAARRRLGV